MNARYVDAASIATGLDKPRRNGSGKFIACCPVHEDNHASLSITDAGDKTLVHCFAGCSQHEIIDALRSKGLWAEQRRHRSGPIFTKEEILEMRLYIAICQGTKRPLTPDELAKTSAYRKVLLSQGLKA